MDHRILKTNHHPLSHIQKSQRNSNQSSTISFHEQLEKSIEQSNKLKLSRHAEKRLNERNITIDQELWAKIEQRISEAKLKGVKDSLVVTEEAALVVSAKNNTVITAMDRKEASSQIFTNINGTILI